MREAGGSFAERVELFESRFGPVTDEMLAVLAQAAFLCWVNVEASGNLLAVCEAIRAGKPTPHTYHCQITAARWDEMHTYLVGIQRWLGIQYPLPQQVDYALVDLIGAWLGERYPAKVALCELLLIRLVDDLLNDVSLARFGPATAQEQAYADYSTWYWNEDGVPYAIPRIGDSRRLPFSEPLLRERTDRLVRIVRGNMTSPSDAEQLIERMQRQTQPPCMHRFSRYLDVQITSIGALEWRGNLPPDTVPKAAYQTFRSQSIAALEGWVSAAPADGERARRIYAALGMSTELKRAVVRHYLLAGFWDVGDATAWEWLVPGAQVNGTNAYGTFGLERVFGKAQVAKMGKPGE